MSNRRITSPLAAECRGIVIARNVIELATAVGMTDGFLNVFLIQEGSDIARCCEFCASQFFNRRPARSNTSD